MTRSITLQKRLDKHLIKINLHSLHYFAILCTGSSQLMNNLYPQLSSVHHKRRLFDPAYSTAAMPVQSGSGLRLFYKV